MKAHYTAQELAAIIGNHRTSVIRRADRDNWLYSWDKSIGGAKKKYLAASLPADIRAMIQAEEFMPALAESISPMAARLEDSPLPPLPTDRQQNALHKADLLRLYLRALAAAPWGMKDQARADFTTAYNSGITYPTLYEKLGRLSWKTIEGWKVTLEKNGRDCFHLADRRGLAKRGQISLTPEQTDVLLRCALHPNRPRISEAIRMARAVMHHKQVPNGHSDATYRRWLDDWKNHNYHIWVFHREGAKSWNDKCARYIERDYNLINVGDILVADGHTLNFEILNPWTGKPKRMVLILWKDMKSNFPLGWEIMPTEDTAAINSALRRAILMLGKYPQVAYLDNGRAFRARFFSGCASFEEAGFSGLYERLGMKTIHAWPYHGQSKTVERFFGTFSELERFCPTYTGTSIEAKPPRMNRGERLHRRAYEKAYGGQVITLEQAHRAIASWFDEYIRRPQRGHLDGQSPLDLFMAEKGPGIDPVELRFLMMSLEIKTIHRNGISFQGQNYYHPALYGRRHPVTIRYDLQDKSALWVFDEAGEFLCAAEPVDKVHPAASALGSIEDQEKLTRHIEMKKSQEKEASCLVRDFLETEVLPEHRRMLALQGITETAGSASLNKKKPALVKFDEAKIAAQVARITRDTENDEAVQMNKRLEDAQDGDRYDLILQMEAQGQLIPKRWQNWRHYYEETPEYRRDGEYWENRRIAYAVMYQSEGGGRS